MVIDKEIVWVRLGSMIEALREGSWGCDTPYSTAMHKAPDNELNDTCVKWLYYAPTCKYKSITGMNVNIQAALTCKYKEMIRDNNII